MCGIAGFQLAESTKARPAALDRFQSSLLHRGPDAQAHHVVGQTGLVATRLAIVDLAGGDQPLFSKKGLVLVANGEIYNAPELRKGFPDYPFYTGSDCEPILALYETYGLDFVDRLRGMYAVAIVDPDTGRLILSRDPFGIKPLYFVEGPDFFAFASEFPALVDAGFAEADVDDVSLAELLQVKYVCGTRTINPAIRRLEPGETFVVEGGRIRERRAGKSWPPNANDRAPARTHHFAWRPPTSLLKKFEKVMFDSVTVHLRTDAPWRLFYSGGIDSTILMLAAREVAVSPYQALTVGYEGKSDRDESWDALRLAHGANVSCERIEMTSDDFWTLAPRIAAAMDDPIADQAALPLYMLGRETRRQSAKVAVCGEGGDEIFGGYSRYQRATLPAFLRRRHGRRGVFSKSEVSSGRFAGWNQSLDALERSQEKLWPSRLEVLQAIDILEWLPNCLLIKLDRALMANGVEGRTPFLDREVIKFAAELPGRFKAVPGQGKRLLRDWLARAYPQSQPYAKKRGFGVPVAKWMHARRDELGRLVSVQPGVARAVDALAVKQVFDRCLEHDQQAWSLLFYALWHSHHILGLSCEGDIAAVLTDASRGD
jgi:asparagine synthase (glutamine-hydrolysing)